MRGIIFARRVGKELLRDPLSYIFCLATPAAMLLLFFIIYQNMPPEAQAGMAVFRQDSLSVGISYFGYSFVMLLAALIVSRDRTTAFLTRLRATPMTSVDFLVGYFLPLLVLGLGQTVLTFCFSAILGGISDTPLSLLSLVHSVPALLPSLVFFIACGLLFGSLLSVNAAPGVASVLITLSGVMGGVWMPLEEMPSLARIFSFFPFLHGVRLARYAYQGSAKEIGLPLVVTIGFAAVVSVLAVFAVHRAGKQEAA